MKRGLVFKSRLLRHAGELRRAKAELDLRVTEQDSAAMRQRLLDDTARIAAANESDQRRTEILQERIGDLWRTELMQHASRHCSRPRPSWPEVQEVVLLAAPKTWRWATNWPRTMSFLLARDRRALVSIGGRTRLRDRGTA